METYINVMIVNGIMLVFLPDIGYCYIDNNTGHLKALESSEELINLCGDSLINSDLINKIDAYCTIKKLL